MYVYARITGWLPEAPVLPASALVKQGDAIVCFLIENGKALRTPVQVGRTDGQFTQFLQRQTTNAAAPWVKITGQETVAASAAGLVDGQSVQTEPGGH